VLEPGAKYIYEAFSIALEKGVPIHDALYIALAMGEKMPLWPLTRSRGAPRWS